MKKTYLIQFKSSDAFFFESKVKTLGSWVKYFDDNWIVETTLTAKEIYDKLSVGNTDKSIFIIQLDISNYWGRMNSKLWDYLKLRRKYK
ncbi:hypothetical protein [Flavobacterium sp.]|jgi:hypothetical protein|uniref:hypothetical protein n=1 Tax=Flavobacterium sp. TaxID=239 RepID=UPI0037BFCA99